MKNLKTAFLDPIKRAIRILYLFAQVYNTPAAPPPEVSFFIDCSPLIHLEKP